MLDIFKSIKLGYENFDFREKLAASITSLTMAEIQDAYRRLVLDKPRRLWAQTEDKNTVNSKTKDSMKVDQHYLFPF